MSVGGGGRPWREAASLILSIRGRQSAPKLQLRLVISADLLSPTVS